MKLIKSTLLVVPLSTGNTEISFPKNNSILLGKKITALEIVPDAQSDYSPEKLLNSTDNQLKTMTVTLQIKGTDDVKQIPAHRMLSKNYNGNILEMNGQVIDWDKSRINMHTVLSSLSAGACVIFNVYFD